MKRCLGVDSLMGSVLDPTLRFNRGRSERRLRIRGWVLEAVIELFWLEFSCHDGHTAAHSAYCNIHMVCGPRGLTQC